MKYTKRLNQIAGKPPGLYVAKSRFRAASLMAKQQKTIENAMEWGGVMGMAVYIDPELDRDEWYIITDDAPTAPVKA